MMRKRFVAFIKSVYPPLRRLWDDFSPAVLRISLVFVLGSYLISGLAPWAASNLKPVRREVDSETGMGGGGPVEAGFRVNSQAGDSEAGADFQGVPEPAEYSKPRTLLYSSYKVKSGDIVGDIAMNLGLNQDTLISVNNIKNTRLLQIGQVLRIPNQDGVIHRVKEGESLSSIAEKYGTDLGAIRTVNELFSDALTAGGGLFIPGARLDAENLKEINGDLFTWPVMGYITSPYGYRTSPFNSVRQFHSGLDIGAPTGTPIRAAMGGRVTAAGWDDTFGNYVVITHHSNYRTLYAHMSVIRVKAGAQVGAGERLGDVGSTGMSTGPHLHFTVYKNGITVNPRNLMK